jgi:hypothetical protein
MVVVKLKINHKGPFNFIMDTGVGLMIITDPNLIDTLKIPMSHRLKLRGFGENDSYEAFASPTLDVGIPGLTSYALTQPFLLKISLAFQTMPECRYMAYWGMNFLTTWRLK